MKSPCFPGRHERIMPAGYIFLWELINYHGALGLTRQARSPDGTATTLWPSIAD